MKLASCNVVSLVLATTLTTTAVAWQPPQPQSADQHDVRQLDLFISGQGGYHTYRIPSIVVTTRGTLLAFCEGRKRSQSDAGDIDLLVRRSVDGGNTWSPIRVLWDDGPNTCGNPCAVVDRQTGTTWLLLTWNAGDIGERRIKPGFGQDSRRVFVTHSSDDGVHWAKPEEITRAVKKADWTWYATGPGAGIQLQKSKHAGRLVIPCDHKEVTSKGVLYKSHVILSDDHGRTWRRGGTSPRDNVNECEAVELSDGRMLLNMRNYDVRVRARQICFSSDGGSSWHDQRHDPTLVEPICQASVRRCRWPTASQPGVILFSNPASTKSRRSLTIRASFDDGASWKCSRVLYPGSAAYSCLCVLDDGSICCLYERDGYKRITLARFTLAWVTRPK